MAESMLLLVFCLLLVAAAIIGQQRKENEDALKKMSEQVELLKQSQHTLIEAKEELETQLTELQAQAPGNARISEDWSELNFAKKLIKKYKSEGVSGEQLSRLVQEVKTVIAMQAQGITGTDLKNAQTDLVAMDMLKDEGITSEDLAKLAPALVVLKDSQLAKLDAAEIGSRLASVIDKISPEDIAIVSRLKAEGITSEDLEKLAPALAVLKEKEFAKFDAAQLRQQVTEAIDKNSDAPETSKAHQWPPIINLSEAEGYSFNVGSAQLDKKLKEQLEGTITTKIAKILNEYDVDLIEVIGHTDEQPLAGVPSNMDRELNPVLSGKTDVSALRPGDNAGLGLARAVAVAQVLQRQPELKKATVLPYSAAQLILPGDRITEWVSKDDKSRRRIEIRVRRRGTPEALN